MSTAARPVATPQRQRFGEESREEVAFRQNDVERLYELQRARMLTEKGKLEVTRRTLTPDEARR